MLGKAFGPCDINVNKKYVKNSCGMNNGLYIEKIEVDSLHSFGMPAKYTSTYITSFDSKLSRQKKIKYISQIGQWTELNINRNYKQHYFETRLGPSR